MLIADRDRLTAEVLSLQDAVMESDARACRVLQLAEKWESHDGQLRVVMQAFAQEVRAALSPATSTGSEVGK